MTTVERNGKDKIHSLRETVKPPSIKDDLAVALQHCSCVGCVVWQSLDTNRCIAPCLRQYPHPHFAPRPGKKKSKDAPQMARSPTEASSKPLLSSYSLLCFQSLCFFILKVSTSKHLLGLIVQVCSESQINTSLKIYVVQYYNNIVVPMYDLISLYKVASILSCEAVMKGSHLLHQAQALAFTRRPVKAFRAPSTKNSRRSCRCLKTALM